MSKTGYYLFDAGINYRDDVIGINELRDANNLHWRGSLERRKGYEERHSTLSTQTGTTQYLASGYQIIDHLRLKTDSGADQHFLFVSMADTAAATNAITVYYTSGLPTATNEPYTPIGITTLTVSSGTTGAGMGHILPWDTDDAFSVVAMDDKVWIGLGDQNPYILFHNGTSWWIHEYPLCLYGNSSVATGSSGNTNGKNIIPGSTLTTNYSDNGDWGGCKFVGAGEGYVYVSDGRTLYWGQSESEIRPDYNVADTGTVASRSSGVHTMNLSTDNPGTPGWGIAQFEGLEEGLQLEAIETYKKYIFLYGNDGIVSFYQRGLYSDDFDKVTETRKGVRGKMIATEKGLFYVGKDGIYGFDGQTATDLSKKIWKHIDLEHSDVTDYDDCTLAYHDGFIWISFPNGTNKEIYVFDPDNIYDDDRGDSHAPAYKYTYTNSTSYTAIGFRNIKEYDNNLYGISSARVHQLDFEGIDGPESTGTSGNAGIPFYMRTGYLDQENPNINKTYRQVIPEVNEGWADGTSGSAGAGVYDFQLAVSVNHSTGIKFRGLSSFIDLEYTTDGGHVSKSLNVPETTAGYILDGNNISVELIGESSNCIPTTADVNIFGFSLDWEAKGRAFEEVSS